jgi:hypothetical protein
VTDIYTVTIVREIEVTTKAGSRMEDLVEVYRDCTWEQVRAYRHKFPEPADITIMNQAGHRARNKFQIDAGGVSTHDQSDRKRVKPISAAPTRTDTYADLINKMAKEPA